MTRAWTRPELATRLLDGQARIGAEPIGMVASVMAQNRRLLQDAGVSTGSVVVVEEAGTADFFAAVLAVWSLDAVPLPCRTVPDISLAQSAVLLDAARQVRPAASAAPTAGLDSTAVLHVTSGTTGTPKLARRGIASVLAEAEGYRRGLTLTAEDRVYIPVPLAHSYGWGVAFGALMAGCQLDAPPMIHPRRAAGRLDGDATVVAVTASLARLLAGVAGSVGTGSGPRLVMVGASQVKATLDDAFADRFGLRLARNYGSSETGATFIGQAGLPEDAIGRPMHGVTVLAPVEGQSGELRLRLAAPVEGHLGESGAATSEWSTGDLVRQDSTGVVRFIARLRSMARLNDRSIDVHGVEQALSGVPGAAGVFTLILARPGADTEDLYAVVAGTGIDPEQVESRRASLPDGTRSVRIVYCDSLPTAPNGKIDRARTVELVRAKWGLNG